MSWKRTLTNMVKVKTAEVAPTTITASGGGSTITALGTAFAVGTDKKYSSVKVVYPFQKTGSAAVAAQIELQSDTGTASAYQSLTNTDGVTITAVGTDNAHGYVATTGVGLVTADFDLNQVKAGTNLKIKISCTFTASTTDATVGIPLYIFAGARNEPPSSTLVSTTA